MRILLKIVKNKPVQIASEFRIRNGLSSRNPREFANQLFAYNSNDFLFKELRLNDKVFWIYRGFILSVLGDFNLEFLGTFTSFGVFKSVEELSKDSESIRDNTRSITRVNTFFNDLDLNIQSFMKKLFLFI